MAGELAREMIEVSDFAEANELFHTRGWTDGLPIVPPAAGLVKAMLGGIRRDPDDEVAAVPPRNTVASVHDIAINAVMAGCRPSYLPVVVAAVEAACDPAFNLNGVQATTHVCAPLIVVNGPVRSCLQINCSANCFGQGARANAAIGRALRLVMINLGGGIPGVTDKSTFGHPGKYTYCVGENEEASPWEPLHVELGYDRVQSTVTLFAAEAPHSVTDHLSNDPVGILTSIADALSNLGSNNMHLMGQAMAVISPEHARTIAKAQWDKRQVKEFIFKHAGRRFGDLTFHGRYGPIYNRHWPASVDREDPEAWVPMAERPEDILVVVAGGDAGRFSLAIPGWGKLGSTAVTRALPEYVNTCEV
jgi:hypothetical protein